MKEGKLRAKTMVRIAGDRGRTWISEVLKE